MLRGTVEQTVIGFCCSILNFRKALALFCLLIGILLYTFAYRSFLIFNRCHKTSYFCVKHLNNFLN